MRWDKKDQEKTREIDEYERDKMKYDERDEMKWYENGMRLYGGEREEMKWERSNADERWD